MDAKAKIFEEKAKAKEIVNPKSTKKNYPEVSKMVQNAIKQLKENGGSSFKTIKQYISSNYTVNMEEIEPRLKKYILKAVANDILIQPKGKGLSGSFKLKKIANKTESGDKPNQTENKLKKLSKTGLMVVNAINTLAVRKGSSLIAIKNFMSMQYDVDADKLTPFIKKFVKSAVEEGDLIQTKGKGASGSFKLSLEMKKEIEKAATKGSVKKDIATKGPVKKDSATKGPVKKDTATKGPVKRDTAK